MIIPVIPRARRSFLAGLTLFSTFLYFPVLGDEPTRMGLPVVESMWCRVSFDLASPPNDLDLIITAPGVTSVYLNGQRLSRDVDLGQRYLKVAVGTLLRAGRNCLAFAITQPEPSADEAERRIGVELADAPISLLQTAAWSTTISAPPPGWQTTDFNDRDWKKLPAEDVGTVPPDWKPVPPDWPPAQQMSRRTGDTFQFRKDDHVVLLGSTFIERAAQFGHLESALAQLTQSGPVTFRNMGWSADTVFAESRGMFDTPERGYERLIEHVRAEEPDVIIVCYGQNEAMTLARTESGRKRFREQLGVLHDDLSVTRAEIVYLSSHPFLTIPPPLPDPTHWNRHLSNVNEVVRDFATERNALYVDLFTDFSAAMEAAAVVLNTRGNLPPNLMDHLDLVRARNSRWTDNGMHWTEEGYKHIAAVLASRLSGKTVSHDRIDIDSDTRTIDSTTGNVRVARRHATAAGIAIEYQSKTLSAAPVRVRVKLAAGNSTGAGVYVESVDPEGIQRHTQHSPGRDDGHRLFAVPRSDYEHLRQLVIRKNELYFHRWRPQNITYLLGFRKHEQGNNASEIARFDPLIAELETQIQAALQPQWQTIVIRGVQPPSVSQ